MSADDYEYRVTVLWSGREIELPQYDEASALLAARTLSEGGYVHSVQRRRILGWETTAEFHNGEVMDPAWRTA